MPSSLQSTLGHMNALHMAAYHGSTRSTLALLSQGSFDVNRGCDDGTTPLIFASYSGSSGCVRALVDAGADVSIAKDEGFTALLTAAQYGNLAVTKMLMKAGADLEAATICQGATALHLAAENGHTAVVSALVEAGAKIGSRRLDGSTPLYIASRRGRTDTVRMLLRARADPLLAFTNDEIGQTYVPLDTAAMYGHSEVVRELLQQFGIAGCGGWSGGYDAFRAASFHQRLEILAMLVDAGVVDKTGEALTNAAQYGHEKAVKYLVEQGGGMATNVRAYVNACDADGRTPLMVSVVACLRSSPRIVRLLIDAGADTSTADRVDIERAVVSITPLGFVANRLHQGKTGGATITEQQRHTLEAIHSTLLREEAIHALSWVWPRAAPTTARAVKGSGGAKTPSTSLRTMLPILRRRNGSHRRTLLRTMFRHSSKNDRVVLTEWGERHDPAV